MRTTGDIEHELTQCRAELAAAIEREAAAKQAVITKLPKLNDALRDILGRPCFALAAIARRLDELDIYAVARKAEAEQAAALHWMLNTYLEHGDKWMEVGNAILKGEQKPEPSDPPFSHIPATVLPPSKEGV